MATCCIDASAALSWLLQQGVPSVEEFWVSLLDTDELVAAQLLIPECASVLRRAVYMKRMAFDAGQTALEELLNRPFRSLLDHYQFTRAVVLAERFQHKKAYDMQYLAAAEITGSILVTRDRGMRHAAQETGVPVRFLT